MNKTVVVGVAACWTAGLIFLFQIKEAREIVRQQLEEGRKIVHKILGQSAPEWLDYPDFRASGERVPKGVSPSSIGGGRRGKEAGHPGPSVREFNIPPVAVSRREKTTSLPGPPPRRSGLSGRDQPRRSSDTRSASSSHISFFRPRILDGDTIRHKRQKVRLSGIDAPERDQPYGSKATRALARQLRRGKVNCQLHGRDKYDRHLGTCYVQGQNVNEWMVRNGHA